MLIQQGSVRSPVPKLTSHLIAGLRSLGCSVVTHPWGREADYEPLVEKVMHRASQVRSARHSLTRQQFDVAVVTTSHDWRTVLRDIAVALAIRRRCRPVALLLHGSRASKLAGSGDRMFKLATAALLSLVDGVMVLSTEEQHQWQAFRRRPPVFVVKNPYVRVVCAPSDPPADGSERPLCALFVGRLIEEKGIFDIVEALPYVLEQLQCELVVVGEGPREQELRERIARLGLEQEVRVTGYLSGSELTDAYRQSTIFLLPTSWDEGFPTVLAEAMDAGLPIITTRIRGAADYLVEGENALFVQPHDVEGLAAAVVTLLSDADLRARMASVNREVLGKFEPGLVAAEYLEILQSLVRDHLAAESAG